MHNCLSTFVIDRGYKYVEKELVVSRVSSTSIGFLFFFSFAGSLGFIWGCFCRRFSGYLLFSGFSVGLRDCFWAFEWFQWVFTEKLFLAFVFGKFYGYFLVFGWDFSGLVSWEGESDARKMRKRWGNEKRGFQRMCSPSFVRYCCGYMVSESDF